MLADPDTYWHIAVGHWIIQHGTVPDHGIFSSTMPDAPWVAHSIHVLTLENDLISTLTLFAKPAAPSLFPIFGLPLALEPGTLGDLGAGQQAHV